MWVDEVRVPSHPRCLFPCESWEERCACTGVVYVCPFQRVLFFFFFISFISKRVSQPKGGATVLPTPSLSFSSGLCRSLPLFLS